MTTDQPTAPGRVPDDYIDWDTTGDAVTVNTEFSGQPIAVSVENGVVYLSPDQADALADAIKLHARAARNRNTHE